jgi:hypothetical protein
VSGTYHILRLHIEITSVKSLMKRKLEEQELAVVDSWYSSCAHHLMAATTNIIKLINEPFENANFPINRYMKSVFAILNEILHKPGATITYLPHAEKCFEALILLIQYALNNVHYKFIRIENIDIIIKVLRMHGLQSDDSATCAYNGLRILHYLLTEEKICYSRKECFRFTVLTYKLMVRHQNSSKFIDIFDIGFQILAITTENSNEVNRLSKIRLVNKEIVSIFSHSLRDERVILIGLKFLLNFCVSNCNTDQRAIQTLGDEGICRLLVNILNLYRRNIGILELVLAVVASLSICTQNSVRFFDLGMLTLIHRSMCDAISDNNVSLIAREGSWALLNMISDNEDAIAACRDLKLSEMLQHYIIADPHIKSHEAKLKALDVIKYIR